MVWLTIQRHISCNIYELQALLLVHFKSCLKQQKNLLAFFIQDHPESVLLPSQSHVSRVSGKKGFAYTVLNVWINLPLRIKSSTSYPTFKRQVKTHLLNLSHCS